MIPNNEWKPGLVVPAPYMEFDPPLPEQRPRVSAVSIGPEILSSSGGNLTSRYWLVSQIESGEVVIQTTI